MPPIQDKVHHSLVVSAGFTGLVLIAGLVLLSRGQTVVGIVIAGAAAVLAAKGFKEYLNL